MSDLKLFRVTDGSAVELSSSAAALEKDLQRLVEANLQTIFGVEFLSSEHSTGKVHGGRIDTLGIDENGSPVILEYKRHANENVINQGLFYLDWLMDHRGEFELLVQRCLGNERAEAIEWGAPRLICVANSFTRYDEHAVKQIDRNIQLVRYQHFGADLLAVELLTTTQADSASTSEGHGSGSRTVRNPGVRSGEKTYEEKLAQASDGLRELHDRFDELVRGFGDDVVSKVNKNYIAYRRLKNFVCVEVHPQQENLLLYFKLNPEEFDMIDGFVRDVRSIGHYGTGDLEVRVSPTTDWNIVASLAQQAYDEN